MIHNDEPRAHHDTSEESLDKVVSDRDPVGVTIGDQVLTGMLELHCEPPENEDRDNPENQEDESPTHDFLG